MMLPVPWVSSLPSLVQVTVGEKTAFELMASWSVIVSVSAAPGVNVVVSSVPGTCSVQLSCSETPSLS